MYQAPLCGLDLPLDRREGLQHGPRHRPAARRRRPAKLRSASGRPISPGMTLNSDLVAGVKKRMLRLRVEKQRRDVGAVQDVLQIVGGRALPLQGFLELAVERGQFLVERLQFLLRGQQFLVGRLEFLVDGQGFFVDRLLLLARDLEVADGALQFRSAWLRVPARARRPAKRPAASTGRSASARASASSTKQTSSSSSPSLGTGWTSMLNETGSPSWFVRPPATTTRAFS